MIRSFSLLCIAGLLTGCQVGSNTLAPSTPQPELSPAAWSAIAGDMVVRLAEQVGSSRGTVVLEQDPSPFGQALGATLKSWGFEVATEEKTDGKKDEILLSFAIDDFEGQTLAQLSTQTFALARAYSATAKGATPTSPFSVIRRS